MAVGGAGYVFGHAVEAVIGNIEAVEERLAGAILLMLAIAGIAYAIRRRVMRRRPGS